MTLHFSQFLNLVIILASSLVVTAAVCPLAIWVARKTNLLDVPGAAAHKQHRRATPLAGGIALAVGVVVIVGIFRIWGNPFIPLVGAAGIILVFGLWDDARGISAPKKLIGQVLASLVLIATGNYVRFLSGFSVSIFSPTVLTVLNWIITIVWLVGITNAFNLIDSMDGLVVGISILTFGFFVGLTIVSEQTDLARFCAAFLGISIGLFIYNISPAKLFLGDSGAQVLGFILAAVAFIYTPKDFPQGSSWFLPILLLGMPIFDTTLVVVTRLRHHRSIFQADRSHVFHRLVALGLDSSRAVWLLHGTSLVLSLLGIVALYLVPWQSNLIFGLIVAGGIGALIFLENIGAKAGDEHAG